nr:hypothetical protein [Tanacetum cinerariifolium]
MAWDEAECAKYVARSHQLNWSGTFSQFQSRRFCYDFLSVDIKVYPRCLQEFISSSRMESKLTVVMVRPRTILVATMLLLQLRFIMFHRFEIKIQMLAVVKTRQSIFFMHE